MSQFCDHACTRIRTTMIGALSKMENNFGYLWGHFKDGPLTEQEEKFADLWDDTRNAILNQGNKEIRNLKQDYYKRYPGYLGPGIPLTIHQKFKTNLQPPKE